MPLTLSLRRLFPREGAKKRSWAAAEAEQKVREKDEGEFPSRIRWAGPVFGMQGATLNVKSPDTVIGATGTVLVMAGLIVTGADNCLMRHCWYEKKVLH